MYIAIYFETACRLSFYKHIDGHHGDIQPHSRLCSECHAETERVLHEPGQEPAQTGQQKDTEAHLNYSAIHHKLVCSESFA